MRIAAALTSAVILALGCEGTPVVYSAGDDFAIAVPPSVASDPSGAAAFDPHLDGFESIELRFRVEHASGATCAIELTQGDADLGALDGALTADACTASWDGRDATGAVVPPGVVEATAVLTRGRESARATTSVEVLRLGVSEVALTGAGRIAVLYSALDGLRYGYYEVEATAVPWRLAPDAVEMGGAPLELADGTPRERPEPWDDLTSPPLDGASADGVERDTFNLPTAWIAGSTVDVSARFTTAYADGVADPTLVEVRAVAPEGLSLLDPPAVVDGAEVALETTASPIPAVGRYDVTWAWRFEARRDAASPWVPVPGHFDTTHRFYGVVAEPTFGYDEVPHRAWVDVLDRVTGWVDGASADPDAVASRIVEGVYLELGLRYDRMAGASHYTDYPGGWERATFELSRFQDLSSGTIVNCSDAASIVSTYANMVGIDLSYHIIQHQFLDRFELNYLSAIGFDFAPSPFTSGRSAFRYHAITGPPDTRVFDATLAVDGDDDPGSAPNERLLVQGLTQADYLYRLSPESDRVRVTVEEKVRIR
ncbi:MAG: hypothetical protein H6719_26015 [Sandaracinaceae bacterium]|nr:hypothetical protein [Sandaracinaceae bacterium]